MDGAAHPTAAAAAAAPSADPARAAHLARLQAQADASAAAAKREVDAAQRLRSERVAMNSLVVNGVLDERHHGADALVAALELLRRVVGNVLDAPAEPKYRAVRVANAAYVRALSPLGEPVDRLLRSCGWRTRTVDMERAWVFEAQPGSDDWARLEIAREVLANAAETMAQKAARGAREREARLGRAGAEQERLRLALADDRQLRALDYEARQRTHAAKSEWQPGQRQGQQQQQQEPAAAEEEEAEEEEEEEDDK